VAKGPYLEKKKKLYNSVLVKDSYLFHALPSNMSAPTYIDEYLRARRTQITRQVGSHVHKMEQKEWREEHV
jgi:hypothetical protein